MEWAAAAPMPVAENQNRAGVAAGRECIAALAGLDGASRSVSQARAQTAPAPKGRRIRHHFHPTRTHRRSTAPASAVRARQEVALWAPGAELEPEPALHFRWWARERMRQLILVRLPRRQRQRAPVPQAAEVQTSPDPSGARLNRPCLPIPVADGRQGLAIPTHQVRWWRQRLPAQDLGSAPAWE